MELLLLVHQDNEWIQVNSLKIKDEVKRRKNVEARLLKLKKLFKVLGLEDTLEYWENVVKEHKYLGLYIVVDVDKELSFCYPIPDIECFNIILRSIEMKEEGEVEKEYVI